MHQTAHPFYDNILLPTSFVSLCMQHVLYIVFILSGKALFMGFFALFSVCLFCFLCLFLFVFMSTVCVVALSCLVPHLEESTESQLLCHQLGVLLCCVHQKSCASQSYILQTPPLYMERLPEGIVYHVNVVSIFLPYSSNAYHLLFLQEEANFVEFSSLLWCNSVVLDTIPVLPHIPRYIPQFVNDCLYPSQTSLLLVKRS